MKSALACSLPESYYLGADVTYIFMALNGLMPWNDQKYKLEEQIYADYPHIQEEFLKGEFPEDILDRFRVLIGSSWQETTNRAFIEPVGGQFWHFICREI